jgi:hypothetical protein
MQKKDFHLFPFAKGKGESQHPRRIPPAGRLTIRLFLLYR